jgi:hypothetical protein
MGEQGKNTASHFWSVNSLVPRSQDGECCQSHELRGDQPLSLQHVEQAELTDRIDIKTNWEPTARMETELKVDS